MVRLAGTYSVLGTQYSVQSLSWSLFVAAIVYGLSAVAAPPKVTSLSPAGSQRGQTIALTAAGDFSTWPVQVWSDRPGLVVAAEKDKGKFKVQVSPDAAAGVYWLRFYNKDGSAPLRPFIVGTLPEVAEAEPNDGPDKLQSVDAKVVVSGKLAKSGDVDSYRLELKSGQTLVASLAANSVLGSPMDAILQVCELVERPSPAIPMREPPGTPPSWEAYVVAQNHDAIGLDPQIAFTADRDGSYLVRVFAFPATPDSSVRFAGGDDYLYRLTLTTGPFLDHCLPLSGTGEEQEVQLGGWNLPARATAIVPPLSAEASPLAPPEGTLTWVWQPDTAGAIAIPRLSTPHATTSDLSVPSVVTGRLQSAGQVDSYTFAARKSEKLRIHAAAKALGFPTDATLAVLDASGRALAEADDAARDDRDPQLDFTPPVDGKYTLTVRDLAGRGDPRLVYRLSIERAAPDFSLSLAADSFVVEKGKTVEIPVSVTVRDGLRDPIELQVVGLPAGITAEPAKFVPGADAPAADSGGSRRGRRGGSSRPAAPSVNLVLKADANLATTGGVPIRIEGRTQDPAPLVRTARFSLALPLAGQHHAAWVTAK